MGREKPVVDPPRQAVREARSARGLRDRVSGPAPFQSPPLTDLHISTSRVLGTRTARAKDTANDGGLVFQKACQNESDRQDTFKSSVRWRHFAVTCRRENDNLLCLVRMSNYNNNML